MYYELGGATYFGKNVIWSCAYFECL